MTLFKRAFKNAKMNLLFVKLPQVIIILFLLYSGKVLTVVQISKRRRCLFENLIDSFSIYKFLTQNGCVWCCFRYNLFLKAFGKNVKTRLYKIHFGNHFNLIYTDFTL